MGSGPPTDSGINLGVQSNSIFSAVFRIALMPNVKYLNQKRQRHCVSQPTIPCGVLLQLLKRGRCWLLVRRFGLADDLMTTPFDPQALERSAIFLCFRANHKDSLN